MKENFSCALNGKTWAKPFIVYIVISLILFIPLQHASNGMNETEDLQVMAGTALFIIVMSVLGTLVDAFFAVVLSRIAFPTIGFRGKNFSFHGNPGDYVYINLKGIVLSLLTAGLYLPWYYKRVTGYFVGSIEFDGARGTFLGSAGKLLKYFILAVLLPLIVWAFALGALISMTESLAGGGPGIAIPFVILLAIVYLSIFILIMPILYLMSRWMFNIDWKTAHLTWETEFWPSVFFLAGQALLSIITIGIYIPAFYVKGYRYFAERTVLKENGETVATFGFEGATSDGFKLLWHQLVLTLCTLGLYAPWAYANCLGFFVTNTYAVTKENTLLIQG